MKEFLLPILVVTVLLISSGVYAYQYLIPKSEKYLENQLHEMTIGEVGIDISVADEPEEREKGLSGLSSLPKKSGLLFIFDTSDHHGIWMKDMNFPIDIIWIDENMRIVDVTEVLKPDSFPAIFEPEEPARMALEVNALFVATHEIKVGQTVRIADRYLPEDLKSR